MEPTYIILWILWFLVIYLIIIYNRLVALKLNRENAFADIDVQLKQRYDLIPQLIETVKWAKDFEQETLQKVIEARSQALWARTIDQKIKWEQAVAWALSWFFWLAESYPDLKSNKNFQELQSEISDIENKLAAARRFFNSATKEFNTWILQFPSNFVAWIFNFKEELFFEVWENREKMEKAPEIKF